MLAGVYVNCHVKKHWSLQKMGVFHGWACFFAQISCYGKLATENIEPYRATVLGIENYYIKEEFYGITHRPRQKKIYV